MIVSEFSLFQCTNLIGERIEEHIDSKTVGKFMETASFKILDSEINSQTVSQNQTQNSKFVGTQMENTPKKSEIPNIQQKNNPSI